MRTQTAIAFAMLLGSACGEPEPEPPPQQPPASDQPNAPEFVDFDVSDEAVEKMTREDLWKIGTFWLDWPQEMPADADKTEIHQRLLEAKYRGVGDFPGPEYLQDLGYEE